MKGHLEATPEVVTANEAFVVRRAEVIERSLSVFDDRDGRGLTAELSAITDDWVTALWGFAAQGQEAALIAVGGYGRRELCPWSDLDLAIHVSDPEAAWVQEAVPRFVAWIRAVRLRLGHSVRRAALYEPYFEEDLRTAVAYLDARVLGPGLDERCDAAAAARAYLRAADDGLGFIARLFDGYRERLERFGQTIYLLEPELKLGKGALRDVHCIRWGARVRGDFDPARETDDALDWEPHNIVDYGEALNWLLSVRFRLHARRGRKHDRLTFPDQEAIAAIATGDGVEAVEALMRNHYRVGRTISRLAERALRKWSAGEEGIACQVDERFRVARGQLAADLDRPLRSAEVFEALRAASEWDALLSPELERAIEQEVATWGGEERADGALGAVLCGLLTDLDTSSRTSTRLLELGILQGIVPEMEPIVCHVQHDVYHVYTTDVHSVKCLEFMRSLLNGTNPSLARWPWLGAVIDAVGDRPVLCLAALFHDIGKNRGGGHSEKGARMMLDVGPRLGLDAERTEELCFLVAEHLALSHIARRHDISDARVIADLADTVQSVPRLAALTVLTVADMSTVGQQVMNDWNAALISELHQRVAQALEGTDERGALRVRLEEIRELLQDPWPAELVEAFLADLPANHVVESDPSTLRRELAVWARGPGPAVDTHPEPELGVTEVVVCSDDQPGALAAITGALSSLGLNILDARILTTAGGRLLDIFRVAQSGGAAHALSASEQRAVTDAARLERIAERLIAVLNGEVAAEELLRKRIAERGLPPKETPEVATSVEELLDVSDDCTVIQVKAPDRIGLLYEIAKTLSDAAVDIRLSKIDSLGTQVVDTFYLQALDGGKLPPDRVAELEAALLRRILTSKL